MEANTSFNRDALIANLSKGTWRIKFYKKNGDIRDMPCTRDAQLIPADKQPTNTLNEDRASKETIRVFVTDIGEWRSFTVANVISTEEVSTDV